MYIRRLSVVNVQMEVKRTVPVKLDVPDERRDDLRTTIEQFNDAANYGAAAAVSPVSGSNGRLMTSSSNQTTGRLL
jgi:hypothetical protein